MNSSVPNIAGASLSPPVGAHCAAIADGSNKVHVAYQDVLKAALHYVEVDPASLKATVSEYPGASVANQPNHRWYERGYGPRWSRKDGSIGGRKTSEMLNRSWGIARKSWGAIVGSRASYSPVVHSHKEQARSHRARGWVTDKMAVDKLLKSGKVDRAVKAAVAWVLKGRG